MRTLAVALLAACPWLSPLHAQAERDPEQLLRAKLASPFLSRADWTTDYDEALARASERSQLVLGYFTTAAY